MRRIGLFFCIFCLTFTLAAASLASRLTADVLAGGTATLEAGTWTTGTFTIPAGFRLAFAPGACLEVEKGATLTIDGRIDAGLQQIFT